ncbi:MAG TPA: MarR family winged helix-turn-helix transcriptional regulator [Vicinamibacteria bacterium]|nr:MarR family winged helix-turn-helix transcriptional regulator [Vicinamibacteria bacterium]
MKAGGKHAATADAARLRGLIAAIVRRFSLAERADVVCCGLTVAQAATLEALRAGPVRLGPLARSLGITPSTLSRNLVRLEAERLVAREADPGDARAARVTLTAAGDRAAARVEAQELEFAAEVLARLGRGRGREVMAALSELLGAVREETETCCPGAFEFLMEDVGGTGDGPRRSRDGECCGRK